MPDASHQSSSTGGDIPARGATSFGTFSNMLHTTYDVDEDDQHYAGGDNEEQFSSNKEGPLPPSLACLINKDIFRFGVRQESLVDPFTSDTGKSGYSRRDVANENVSPIEMAITVVVPEQSGRLKYNADGTTKPLYHKTTYNLQKDLSLSQIRRLAGNMGLKKSSSMSRDYIRRALAIRYRAHERYADANPSLNLIRFEDYVSELGRQLEADENENSFVKDGEKGSRPRKRSRMSTFDSASLQEDDPQNEEFSDDPSRSVGSSDSDDVAAGRLPFNSGDSTYDKMLLVGALTRADMRKRKLLHAAEISNTLLEQARDLEKLGLAHDIVQRMRNHADHHMRIGMSMPTANNFDG